ncbi:hypothetical protein ABIE16_003416 [Pseudomonas sp. 2725]
MPLLPNAKVMSGSESERGKANWCFQKILTRHYQLKCLMFLKALTNEASTRHA